MVITRSQSGADEAREEERVRVFDRPPQSPSSEPSAPRERVNRAAEERLRNEPPSLRLVPEIRTRDDAGARVASAEAAPPQTAADRAARHVARRPPGHSTLHQASTSAVTTAGPSAAPRVRIARSTKSTASAIARLQYEAEERLAAIRRRELEIEADLIRKKLAADVAALESEDSGQEDNEPAAKMDRVFAWLDESTAAVATAEPAVASATNHGPAAVTPRRQQRGEPVATTPGHEQSREERRRSTSRGRGIEQLASVLDEVVRTRPPPRQATDLPAFSGSPLEWLQFSAAMKETTRLYRFTPLENMARLRNSLKGEARDTVAVLLSSGTHPDQVMKTLERCYGRPEHLVDMALSDLKKIPKLGTTANELTIFAVKIQNVVTVLQNVQPSYLHTRLLAREILEKMHLPLKSKWYDYAALHAGKEAEVVTLSKFLLQEADNAAKYDYAPATSAAAASAAAPRRDSPRTASRPEAKKKTPVYAATTEDTPRCPACAEPHTLPNCKKFNDMPHDDRWDLVKKEELCFKCIVSRHRRRNCRAKLCGANGCKRSHHRLLHPTEATPAASKDDEAKDAVATVTAASTSNVDVKLKICPVIVSGKCGSQHTYALFDEGSTITLVDDELARKIGADGPVTHLDVKGINSEHRHTKSRRVSLTIRSPRDDCAHDITARTMTSLDIAPQSISSEVLRLQHLSDLRAEDVVYANAKPRILIGTDNWPLIVTRELRCGGPREPAASRTELGWVIHGSAPSTTLRRRENTLHVTTSEDRLEELVEKHFKIDALGVSLTSQHITEEDKRAVAIFERTVARREGHFEVGLPWREDNMQLPRSYDSALRRLTSLENKLMKNPQDMEEYQKKIDHLIEKGYAEPCDGSEDSSPVAWYLPHFAVRNPNKPGKLRLVFDAAAKARGVSLNDHLLDGPDLLRSLQTILFRFREGAYAVTADIEEMFLRVKIRPEDQPAQMFLWRDYNQKEPPKKMKMTSMIFGASSSPFLAHSVRNRNAMDHAESHPAALRAITEAHYMDDFVDSFQTIDEARNVIVQVDAVHRAAGFNLRGWHTNDRRLLESTHLELDSNQMTSLGGTEKTLGLLWNSDNDSLSFNTNLPRVPAAVKTRERPPTKREALATVMSIYDPLGLLSCYTITAKITLQKLWQLKTEWDEPLPSDHAEEFDKWMDGLEAIKNLQLPRSYNEGREVRRRDLHVFCDASEDAYAAAAYWVLKYADGHYETALVAARAKVAPLKQQTVPRLELQAALIGSRLAKTIRDEHRLQVDQTIFWSDSQTVLHWLRNGSRRYTPFVAHRLGEITESSKPSDWHWVPTHLNIADVATRAGYTPTTSQDEWFTGPAFLMKPKTEWPRNEDTTEEPTAEVLHITTTPTDDRDAALPDISRFSNFDRLIGATAQVLLVARRCRDRKAAIDADIIRKATDLWLQRAQRESFPAEIDCAQKKIAVSRASPLHRLNIVWEDGLLKLNGRINKADAPTTTKRPIVLHGQHPLTRLLVEREHRRAGHANNERVVNDLRQQFWILRLRPTIRAVAAACPMCRLRRMKPRAPLTGDLPEERLQPYHRPFSCCGLDYFGPMTVTIGRRREKRWGALFTCLTTRAVHLELVASLSTDSALMALRRMAARRGWPATIYSDNGTNFRGADAELTKAYEEWLPELQRYAANKETTWKFIAPGAPNQGGAWERLVRSVKTALHATLRERAPKEEVLSTLLAEAEHAVNSRPLTHVSVNADDPEALTPNHFLLGSSRGLPLIGPTTEADRRTWRATQALADMFWRRWVREYLPTLVPRRDHPGPREDIQVGDIVIIADSSLPRNTWPRGEVVRTFPGPDGIVRVAEVRTKGGIFRRPTNKLVRLNIKPAPSPDQREGTRCATGTGTSTK